MRFIKNNVYACTFTPSDQELPAIFYGVYMCTKGDTKQFKYLNCVNYGTWYPDVFNFKVNSEVSFTDLGTIKQNPELFI